MTILYQVQTPEMSDVPTGSLASYTTFYRSPEDEGDECTWMKEEPEDVADAAEDEETAKHAFIIRVEKANDSRKKYQLHSIIIQSELLKEALGVIFEDYPGVSCSLKRLEFEAPFKPFVHRWLGLLKFKNKQGLDAETAKHLGLLHDVLKEELKDVLEAIEDYGKHGVVTYDHVWTLYPPGSIVYTQRIHGAPGAMRVKSGEYCEVCNRPAFQLYVEMVDFNGSDFCLTSYETINIRPFVGTTKILNLAALPLSFHPYEAQIREAFIQRGKIFEQLTGTHYKEYDGIAITWDAERNEVPTTCDGRIIVDHEAFRRYSPQYLDSMDPLEHGEGLVDPEETSETPEEEDVDRYIFGKQDKHNKLVRLKEEHHLICSPRVRGYSIKKKQWLLFFVDLITEVTFNEKAFESLVLPEDQKELILSFAESQALNSDTIFDDIITGKGRGHITLLSGPPGVGKTLTAESVAEHMHAPLYMMSAGDLGSTPSDVDHNLTQILDMIQRWKAVLLLDECDVFLEARTSSDLERNQMVSIFLRTLEYYQGILFLTSNRIDNIDSAFQSRIHISMAYPDLTEQARRQIWQNFLKSVHLEQEWSEKDFDELSRVELNGRQIKNVVKSAALLSKKRREPLSRKYVDWVMEIERRRPGMHGEGK